ncbi:MAG: peptide ABC transporter ATP-binding protein [Candidatus Angelobacter sp. Gp1-AA117]|nr:MAG: peptide ABC transporter ATP-binding protein [Candidatus Angelobacter sp. Gp1-AA117]
MAALLQTRLTISYKDKTVLREVCLEINEGEVLGLVGHSGCGKSSLALAVLGLLGMKDGKVTGSIRWKGEELLTLKESAWLKLRGKEIAFVPQSPLSSLNPALRIETQLAEAWKLHQSGGKQECQKAILAALENVSLPAEKEFLRRYPSEISVGQAQRVLIAMAILHRPSLLIADEPTSALDAITQSEILDLFSHLNRKLGMSILYISHDLPSVASICDRIAIVNDGEIVECAPPQQIFFAPTHAFTRRLVAALPSMPQMPEKRRGASA